MLWRALAAASIVALWPVSQAIGQQTQSIRAMPLLGVYDRMTGDALEGVQVRDEFSGSYTVTTTTGTVRLIFLTFRGTAAFVRLTKLGFEPKEILVAQGDTTPITELLERVTTLDPIVATERYRLNRDEGRWDGFARRCEQRTVTCFADSALSARATSNMADLLVRASGITIGACGGGRSRNTQCGRVAMRSSVIPPAYCEPSIFVDGFWWNSQITSPIDMQPDKPAEAPFTPANVKGVEVYATDAPRPLKYEGDPRCGAIVIWTR
jgi:hypothetical protein